MRTPGPVPDVVAQGQDVGVLVLSDGIAHIRPVQGSRPFDLRVGEFVDRKPAQPCTKPAPRVRISVQLLRRGAQLLGHGAMSPPRRSRSAPCRSASEKSKDPSPDLGKSPRVHRGRLRGDRRPYRWCQLLDQRAVEAGDVVADPADHLDRLAGKGRSSSFQSR